MHLSPPPFKALEFTLPYQGYQHGIPLSALLPGAGHVGELARTTTGSWPTASKRSFFEPNPHTMHPLPERASFNSKHPSHLGLTAYTHKKIPWDHVFWKQTEQGRRRDQTACVRPLLPLPLIRSWRDTPPAHRGQRLISKSCQHCLGTFSLQQGKSSQASQAPSAVWKHVASLRHLPASHWQMHTAFGHS